ncbi:MAG: enoyl-CoA hydratase/isomerase family protein [Actinomycetota bacterium]
MSDLTTIRYDVEGGVARITLARPEKRNAVNDVMFAELGDAAERAGGDPDVRVILLTGEGPTFCAGIDLGMFTHPAFRGGDDFRTFVGMAQRPYRILQTTGKPSIAAVRGHAVGAGFQLALACDLRICGDDAVFGMFEVRYGIVPDLGGNRPLTRIVGTARAKEFVWTGRTIDAPEAERIGLVNRVVDPEALAKEAEELALELAGAPPIPVGLSKSIIDQALDLSAEESLDLEAASQQRAVESEDHREAIAAFLEKRPPRYTGR